MSDVAVPVARRLQRPGWRDTRLVVGVLLVLLSVLGVARLVASFDDTTPVYAATRALVPGQELTASDVAPVAVRMDDTVSGYVDGTGALQPGTYVLRAVGEGELVPAAALGSARQSQDKTVTVPVDPAAASTLGVGTVVDLWVSRRDPDEAGVRYLEPELLLEQAVVAQVPSEAGALGMGVGRTAVQVVVPADQVAAVISSVDQEARVTLVPSPRSDSTPGR
jgi:hypothetical protein